MVRRCQPQLQEEGTSAFCPGPFRQKTATGGFDWMRKPDWPRASCRMHVNSYFSLVGK